MSTCAFVISLYTTLVILFASIFCAFYTQIFCNNLLPLFSVLVLFFDIRLILYSIKCLFLHKKLVIEGINYGVPKSDFSKKINKLLWLTQKAFFLKMSP